MFLFYFYKSNHVHSFQAQYVVQIFITVPWIRLILQGFHQKQDQMLQVHPVQNVELPDVVTKNQIITMP